MALLTMVTQAQIDRDKIPMPPQRLKNEELMYVKDSIMETSGQPQIIDEVETFKKVKSAFSNEELIQRCQAVILSNFGTKNPEVSIYSSKLWFAIASF